MQYFQWAKLEHEDEFWTDSVAMQMVKDHLSVLANRKNVFTGGLLANGGCQSIYNTLFAHWL